MLGYLRKPAFALALALCMLASLPRSGEAGRGRLAQAATSSLRGGVNVGSLADGSLPGEADRAIAVARQLHATLVRIVVPWSVMEPRGPGRIDPKALAFTDRLASDAAASGIKIIMLADSTPCWGSSAPRALLRRCAPGRASPANAWPPKNPSDYGAFTAYLAGRYGPQLAAIEVWNEPDQANEHYFAGPDKARRYAAVLRAAYPAIKQVNPNIAVLGGSLVGSNGAFLRALYAAGIKGYYDGLSVHFYNLILASLHSIHEVQRANGDATPLWLAEFGWPSCWPHRRLEQEQACVPARTQAANLADTFRVLARTPYMAAAVVYKLKDSRGEDFGLLSTSGAHKPAFSALAHVLSLTAPGKQLSPVHSGASTVTLGLRRQGPRLIAAGSAQVGDFMLLEAFQGSLLRYRAVFTLDRFNRYSIALPSVLGTGGLSVRVYQYSTGPAGGARRSS